MQLQRILTLLEGLEQGDVRRRRKLKQQGREKGTTLKIHIALH